VRGRGRSAVLDGDSFRNLLARETARATRYQDFFSICLVEADGGEIPKRDLVKIREEMAVKIADSLRSTDSVGRIHWAAFLLVNTSPQDTVRVAERVRGLIEHVAFADGSRATHRITLSVGGASFPQDGANDGLLLHRAEVYLREAVRRGGNQIVGPDDPDVQEQ
jgi:hypothetical protein